MSLFRKPTQPDSDIALSNEQKQATAGLNLPWPIATQLTLGMGTLAVIALTQAGRLAAQGLTQIGLSSEELFRGDRLPSRPLIQTEQTDSGK